MKTCKKCLIPKNESEFYKQKGCKNGLSTECKICKNERVKDYHRTKKGVITQIYSSQRQRSKLRGHPMPTYTKEQLTEWLFSQSTFHQLYDNWKSSGFEKMLAVSCDRTSDYLPYDLSRLQLMTWQHNEAKGHADRKNGINNKCSKAVNQYDKNGNFIKQHYSGHQAERETGIERGNIGKCCKGKVNGAGGFKWQYAG